MYFILITYKLFIYISDITANIHISYLGSHGCERYMYILINIYQLFEYVRYFTGLCCLNVEDACMVLADAMIKMLYTMQI